MDVASFLGLEAGHNPYRYHLPVTAGISTGGRFLFGGCGLGAAISAMETTTGRPLIWATAQYLNYARTGSVVDIDVTVAVAGRQTSQVRAVGHVADQEIFTVNAALGARELPVDQTWATAPKVPDPESCGPRLAEDPAQETILDRLDMRLADARPWDDLEGRPKPGGRSALWARLHEDLAPSAGALAILGDYVPFGIGQALGARAGGNSLDNTLRVVRIVPTEWILIDVQVDAVHHGFGHGTVHLYSRDGDLMAVASQSTIVRYWQDRPGRRGDARDLTTTTNEPKEAP